MDLKGDILPIEVLAFHGIFSSSVKDISFLIFNLLTNILNKLILNIKCSPLEDRQVGAKAL